MKDFISALGVYLIVVSVIWALWINILPSLWPTGPVGFISPSWLLFVGATYLLLLIKQFFK